MKPLRFTTPVSWYAEIFRVVPVAKDIFVQTQSLLLAARVSDCVGTETRLLFLITRKYRFNSRNDL